MVIFAELFLLVYHRGHMARTNKIFQLRGFYVGNVKLWGTVGFYLVSMGDRSH